MKDFLSSIGIIKQGFENWKEKPKNNKGTQKRKNSDQEVENILLDSKKEEDIIFYHYEKSNLIKLEYDLKNNNESFSFLEYDMDIENDKIYLDEKEIENIKTYHVLNVLKPKIETYLSYKDIEFNCTFMRNIYSYAEEIGFENTIGYLLPLIQDLNYQKNKCDNILLAFLDTFEKLLIYLRQFDTDHTIIIKKLLPIISIILTTKKEMNMLNKAVNALKFLMENITMDECLNYVFPLMIEMGNNERNEIGQTISIQIFSEKASYLGGEIIELYVLPMFQSFSESINENLRMSCIRYMIPLFENINYDIIQTKFIKIYKNFSKDKSFQIRKLSCNMLPIICKTILNNNNNYDDTKIKKEELISKNILDIFFGFTEDEGKEIQYNALSIFGEFIYYLDNDIIVSNPKLLDYYTDKIDKLLTLYKNRKIDSTIIYKVCYSFPSILFTYYKKVNDENEKNKNWEKLKPIYIKFIKSKEFRIKNSIASSFGEVSSMLSLKIVEKDLSPLISEMYYNNGAKIKNVIITIIPKLLMQIKDTKIRSEFLVIYKRGFNTIKNIKNWREKLKYLKGIKKMGNFFENYVIFEDIVGMLIEMCFDLYSVIRKKSVKILSFFLLKFLLLDKKNADIKNNYNSENSDNSENGDKDTVDYKQNAIIILNSFATCKHCHYRQLFIYLCKKIIRNEKIFMEYAYELFNELSYDTIVNVRYTLAYFINMIWNHNKKEYEWIKQNGKIIEIIYRLKNDKEIDVKRCVEKIDINMDKIENKDKILESKIVNTKFNNEFQEFKKIFDYVPFLGKSWIKKK